MEHVHEAEKNLGGTGPGCTGLPGGVAASACAAAVNAASPLALATRTGSDLAT
jgi:hypothetical protein